MSEPPARSAEEIVEPRILRYERLARFPVPDVAAEYRTAAITAVAVLQESGAISREQADAWVDRITRTPVGATPPALPRVLDFGMAVTLIRRWEGREVVVTLADDGRPPGRPTRGVLHESPAHAGAEGAVAFRIEHPHNPRLVNPDGSVFALHEQLYAGGEATRDEAGEVTAVTVNQGLWIRFDESMTGV